MANFFQLLGYPFVERALIAGIFAGALLAALGVFVTLRKMAFFSEGIAHASLAGAAIGILLGGQPLLFALLWGVVFAIAIFFLERKTTIAADSLIGLLFSASLALGVLLINLKAGYQPDLIGFLFGNILTIKNSEVWLISLLAAVILWFLITRYKTYLFISLNKELAALSQIPVARLTLLLYIILAVATILSIKVMGIVLVSALLIIPISSAKLTASSARALLFKSIAYAEGAIVGGILLSLLFNVPTSSIIVIVSSLLFAYTLLRYGKK